MSAGRDEPGAATPPWMGLVGSLILVSLVSAAGGSITATSIDSWYPTLAKPALTPPNAVFPIVWTTLFLFMGIAAFLVWRQAGSLAAARLPFGLYGAQLLLNMGWSALFFGLRAPLAAGIEIFVLIAAVAATTWLFWQRHRAAGLLMAPYLAWSLFAAWLNWRIVLLNP